MRKKLLLVFFGFVAWCSLAARGVSFAAEAYPNKPISFVTHSGPGGGMDTMLRRMADILGKEKIVTQPIHVENIQGGSGAKAMTALVKRKGDDHVLAGLTSVWISAPLISPDLKVSYRDMTPIALLGFDPNIVVVKADSPFKSFKELIEFARANPKQVKQAGGSVTSTPNFDRIALAKATGASWDYVAFASGGEAITALLGGHVHLVIGQPADMGGHLKAGTLRPLASFSEARLASYPQVPTLSESGIAARVSRGTIRGILGPPEMPAHAVRFWEQALRRLTQAKAFQQFVSEIELFPKFATGAEFRKILDEETANIAEFLAEIGAGKK
ncbi:MAG TPA: tripartite tricarboxylate transporter substrate binding protein [Candidatus Acidoferrales bacterium]|nr:tripartite tricarboxylate transporter substrate binding protein [Candidatus Acidoferrales bacterium]